VDRLRGTSLRAKLIFFSVSLTVLILTVTFAALSMEVRRQTRRLLADTLDQHQRMVLGVQQRDREDLLWIARLMTVSPTLRAAMEIYQSEHGAGSKRRPDLLATIQAEAERIASGLDRDVLFVTDAHGKVLAAWDRKGAGVAAGLDLSAAPVVTQALDQEAPTAAGGFAVLEIGDRPFQVSCVPIELQGYTIGALGVGDALDADFARRLGRSFDSEVVIALGPRIVAATLSRAPADGNLLESLATQVLATPQPSGPRSTHMVGGEEYVSASLPLGVDGGGRQATIYLLRSLTRALGPSNRTLLLTILVHGSCAVVLAGIAAWLLSRSVLRPLGRFVEFLRVVTDTGDHARRFQEATAGPEIGTLSFSYNQLMDSLQDHEERLLQRAREDLEHMQRLKESEKLAALGRMLSGAAHEINNPLTGVLGNIEFLLADPRVPPDARERLQRVSREGQRIVGLVRNLLKTAHRDGGERSIVDLNRVARECVALRQHDFTSAGMALKLDLTDRKCRVFGSELELQQVFLNIINNAYDALREGTASPELVIRTRTADDTITVEFLDDGPGMREPERVFEHFYTTKEIGKGTGLGLSITHAIVHHHGGRIAASNRPEGGARFVVDLPALVREGAVGDTTGPVPATTGPGSPAGAVGAPAWAAAGALGTATSAAASAWSPTGAAPAAPDESRLAVSVLVVDDEPTVLELQIAILESAGARAVGARTGAAAMEALQNGEFDLVVSDLKMPGTVSGEDLFRWAEANRPAMAKRFVFVTGDTVAESTATFLEKTRRRCVQKPFSIEAYLAALKETLHEQKAA
jgi:signal transduction histidine kinase/CheY-like chemotaxis protein